MRGLQKTPHSRSLPPSLLEWRGIRQKSNMALPLNLYDSSVFTINVDSWTTCEEAAASALSTSEISGSGWSVVLDDAGIITDCNGFDYVLDLVSELELCPSFPASRSQLLKFGIRQQTPTEVDHNISNLPRPQVIIIVIYKCLDLFLKYFNL